MNCNVCDGDTFRAIRKRSCDDCVAETMMKKGFLTLKIAKKFCDCFRFGHDKNKLEEYESEQRGESREQREFFSRGDSNEKTK